MAQTWKDVEKEFEGFFDQYGKGAFVFRFTDTAAAKAISGKRAFVTAQPSDYHVTLLGDSFYAEVKSTSDDTTFHFSNIRKQQLSYCRRVIGAGGKYLFFIKSLHLNQWFLVPGQHIVSTIQSGAPKHLTWEQLKPFKYDPVS